MSSVQLWNAPVRVAAPRHYPNPPTLSPPPDCFLWNALFVCLRSPLFLRQSPAVTVSVGGQAATATNVLSYAPATLAHLLFPAGGDSAGGHVVAFVGQNFGPPTANLSVVFNRPGTNTQYPCRVLVSANGPACVGWGQWDWEGA